MGDFIHRALDEAHQVLKAFIDNSQNAQVVNDITISMAAALKNGKKILACGNGGSMCDSLHFVEELTGRYRKDRPALNAISMDNAGHLTCVGNDYGFEYVFSRGVEAWGHKGDCLLLISTSGNSKNVVLAAQAAQKKGIKTIGLLGKEGGQLKKLCEHAVVVPSQTTDRIQEIHIKLIHIFIEGIERTLYPQLYQ